MLIGLPYSELRMPQGSAAGLCNYRRYWLRLGHAKITANFANEVFVDFMVTRNCRTLVLGRIMPPRMSAAFPEQFATM